MTDLATVAKNLRDIEDMALRLEAHAENQGRRVSREGDRSIPGADAMVNLASVGSLSDWQRRIELAEATYGNGNVDLSNEDPDEFWPAIQMLWFWTEDYRDQLGHDHDDPRWRPTLISEAKFLRNHDVAEWIWNNEVHWDDYAKDVERAKTKLENILVDGERAERGVPCLYEACKGARLVRKLEPYRDKDGEKAWRHSDWHCPRCHRTWDDDQYARNVTAAHERAKVEEIPTLDDDISETWCSYEYAARKVGRPAATIRAWVKYTRSPRTKADLEHPIATACIVVGRRTSFVRLADVQTRHEAAQRRKRAA